MPSTSWPRPRGDGLIALLLAYRVAALRSSNLRDVAWFGVTGAAVVAIAAVALRSIEIPRILGPALLVLVFFLWDAIHGGTPSRRRDPWRLWETVALAALGDRGRRLEHRHPRLIAGRQRGRHSLGADLLAARPAYLSDPARGPRFRHACRRPTAERDLIT